MPATLCRLLVDVERVGRVGSLLRSEEEFEAVRRGGVAPPLAEFTVEEEFVTMPEESVLESLLFLRLILECRRNPSRKAGAILLLSRMLD